MKKFVILFLLVFVFVFMVNAIEISTNADYSTKDTEIIGQKIVNPKYEFVRLPKMLLTIYSEDFEGGVLPAGYIVNDGNSDGYMWDVSDTFSNSIWPPNYGTYFAVYDDYTVNNDSTTETMTLPAIPTAGYDSLMFSYSYSFQDYAGDGDTYVLIRAFTSSWSAWDTLVQYPSDISGTDTFDLSTYNGSDSIQIQYIYYKYATGTGWGASVDNITLTGTLKPDYDLSLSNIIHPNGLISPGDLSPIIEVTCVGSLDMYDFWTYYLITDTLGSILYQDSLFVNDTLSQDEADTITFPSGFNAEYLNMYNITAWLSDSNDILYVDDTLSQSFRTYDIDVSCIAIVSPVNQLNGQLIAEFTNVGSQSIDFYAHYTIESMNNDLLYSDSQYVYFANQAETTQVEFTPIDAPFDAGFYIVKSFSNVNYDLDRANDTIIDTFYAFAGQWEDLGDQTSTTLAQWPSRCVDDISMLWVIGGIDGGTAIAAIQTYDTLNGWQYITDLPTPCFAAAAAVINNKLYVIGGFDASFNVINENQIYDIASDTWTTGTLPPSVRGGVAGGVYNDKMYIIGGSINSSFPTDCPTYCYDPSADTTGGTPWTQLTSCPREATGAGMILGSFFYGTPGFEHIFVGGDYQGFRDMYMYTPSADTTGGSPWLAIGDMPFWGGTKDVSVVWNNEYAYFVGGDVYGFWSGVYTPYTIIYDIANNKWSYASKYLNTPMEGGAAGLMVDEIYSFGGTTGSGPLDPAPFEKLNINNLILAPYLVYHYPADGAIGVNQADPLALIFAEPIDTSRGFSYSFSPNPGLLLNVWNSTMDTLYVYHDSLEMDKKYYFSITEAYDNLGFKTPNTSQYPSSFTFATGTSGINDRIKQQFYIESNKSIVSNSIKFTYYLPEKSDVQLSIYNISGASVYNTKYLNQNSGKYTAKISLKTLPSGKYIYRFKFNDKEINKSFLIIK